MKFNKPKLIKSLLLLTAIAFIVGCKSTVVERLSSKSFQEIHDRAILVDSHNDFLLHTYEKGFIFDTDLKGKTHSDLERLNQGGVDLVGLDDVSDYPIITEALVKRGFNREDINKILGENLLRVLKANESNE